MPEPVPFHYPSILEELAEALRCILQASDFLELAKDIVLIDRQRAESQNLLTALTRIRNAYQATRARYDDLRTTVALDDKRIINDAAPMIERAIADLDTDTGRLDRRVEP